MLNISNIPEEYRSLPYILVEINKKQSLFKIQNGNAIEFSVLPKITKEIGEKLLENDMQSNIFKFLKEYYFISNTCNVTQKVKLPLLRKMGNSYNLLKYLVLNIPLENSRKKSFEEFNSLNSIINNKKLQKALIKLENDVSSQKNVCTKVHSSLSSEDIPTKYVIAYSNLSTYILIDKKWAKNIAKSNNGKVLIFVDEEFLKHVVGVKGKNIKRIIKELDVTEIIVIKKKITD